jgi:hypothetical protein
MAMSKVAVWVSGAKRVALGTTVYNGAHFLVETADHNRVLRVFGKNPSGPIDSNVHPVPKKIGKGRGAVIHEYGGHTFYHLYDDIAGKGGR